MLGLLAGLGVAAAAVAAHSCDAVSSSFTPRRLAGHATRLGRDACALNRSSFARDCVFRFREPVFEARRTDADTRRYANCAVVSSSGALRSSGCGARIDSADAVFRMNDPPLKGFERDVGATCTFDLYNSHVARKLDKNEQMARRICRMNATAVLARDEWFRDEWFRDALIHAKFETRRGCGRKTILLRKEFTHAAGLEQRGDARIFFDRVVLANGLERCRPCDPRAGKTGRAATTGFLAVVLAATLCNRVDLFGFVDAPAGGPPHYYSEGATRRWFPFARRKKTSRDGPGLDDLFRAGGLHSLDIERGILRAWGQSGYASLRADVNTAAGE